MIKITNSTDMVKMARRRRRAALMIAGEPVETKAGRVHVSTSQYERSHGRMPRGEGNWAFFFDRAMNIDTAFWHNGTYSEAKKAAKIEAAKRGVDLVVLGS